MKEANVKQISFRLPESLLEKFKSRLKRESKTITLFITNKIKRYLDQED